MWTTRRNSRADPAGVVDQLVDAAIVGVAARRPSPMRGTHVRLTSKYAKALPRCRVNAVDPGYTATDLNEHRGTKTVHQGAEVIVAMATLGPDGATGTFVDDDGTVPWQGGAWSGSSGLRANRQASGRMPVFSNLVMSAQVSATPARAGGPAIHELSRNRRIGILLICSMSLLIVGLDVTIVNVALPSIGRELHATVSGLQWTVDAYTLVLASLLMLSGSTADRLGRRRTFVIGLSVFSVGSLLCSLAPSLELLVVFRMLQAVGGSMLNPVAMSIITNTFTEPRERAQAVGVWGAVVGISMALGPVLGGLLVSSAGWRSIFWINIPVGVVAIILALRYIPESKAPRARRFDAVGQVLMIVLLATLTYGIIEAPSRGWSSPQIIVAFAAAGASLLGFVLYERRRREPLIDLRFFRSIPFASATVTAVAAFAALGGFLFLNTLYLQEVRGLSPLQAGLDTLPMALMTMVASPLSGRIVGHRGARLPLVVSGIALVGRLRHAGGHRRGDPLYVALRGLRGLRHRLRACQRTHHQCGGVRDAAGAGGRRLSGRLDLPAGRTDAGGGRGRRPRHEPPAWLDPRRSRVGEPRRLVDPGGMRPRGAGPRPRVHLAAGPRVRAAHGRAAQPRGAPGSGAGALSADPSDGSYPADGVPADAVPADAVPADAVPVDAVPADARVVWSVLRDLVLDNERRREVAEALGLSFGRIRAIRRLARKPMSMGELAAALSTDAPYATVVVDDLESQGLVRRRRDASDRRTKVVEVTAKGKQLARRAEAILDTPPPGLSALSGHDLRALRRILEKITTDRPR